MNRLMEPRLSKKKCNRNESLVVIKNELNEIGILSNLTKGVRESCISSLLKPCIDGAIIWTKIPRMTILCFVKIENNGNSVTTCIFNCVSLALLHAGIALNFSFAGVMQ
ncbi:hypothetical protein MXB_3434 [Myxobolus squamalis]|nr:hypothetical protein MXB_3434 [Myxobolus squamalis]